MYNMTGVTIVPVLSTVDIFTLKSVYTNVLGLCKQMKKKPICLVIVTDEPYVQLSASERSSSLNSHVSCYFTLPLCAEYICI